MARLYLIRHAQSANNAIWDGSDHGKGRTPDPEITDIGHRQAAALADYLDHPQTEPRQHSFQASDSAAFAISHVYCSLMTRSILTAQYIAETCQLEFESLPNVFEKMGMYDVQLDGQLSGVAGPTRDYFESRFPQLKLPDDLGNKGWWNRDVESDAAFLQRMQQVVEDFKTRLADSNENIALVAHGDFIDQFINQLMGINRHAHNYGSDWVANWVFHNTSISRIDFNRGSHNVVYLNRIDHLDNELVTW